MRPLSSSSSSSSSSSLSILSVVFFAVVLSSSVILVSGGGQKFNQRVSDPLVQFIFDAGQSDLNADTQNAQVGSNYLGQVTLKRPYAQYVEESIGLRFTNQTGLSLNGVAVTDGARAYSTLNSTALLNAWKASGSLSFEMWIKPASTSFSISKYVIGFGNFSTFGSTPGCDGIKDSNNISSFSVTQNAAKFQPQIISEDAGGARLCFAPTASSFTSSIYHFVLTIAPYDGVTANFFYYINSVRQVPTILPIDLTLWRDDPLQLAFKFSDFWWAGDIYMIAFYNRTLSRLEVSQNYNASLPNSKPVATPATWRFFENGQGNITLTGSDFDGDSMTFQVTSIPVKGTLFRFINNNWTAITAQDLANNGGAVNVTNPVTYQPNTYEYGDNYASFTFRAYDGVAYSLNSKTITINITHVNNPPFPTSDTQYTIAEVANNSLITMNGIDVDDKGAGQPSEIKGALVVSLPSQGTLYLTPDGVTPTTALTPGMLPANVSNPRQLIYISNTPDISTSGQAIVITDTFNFKLFDYQNVSLASASITINVRNSMVPVNSTAESKSDIPHNFSLAGNDYRNSPFDIYLISLPSNGSVFTIGSSAAVTNADLPLRISGPDFSLTYLNKLYAFGYPLDTVYFYMQRISTGYRSPVGQMQLITDEQNHIPVLSSDSLSLTTIANANPTTNQLLYFNVYLFDPDPERQPFKVKVKVLGLGGSVSLNQSVVGEGLLTFVTGDGTSDTLMLFTALPSVVKRAFQGMIFHGASPGLCTLDISVNDQSAVPPQAYDAIDLEMTFQINSNPSANAQSSTLLPTTYLILAWAAILGCPVFCCSCICFRKYKKWRERNGKEVQLPFNMQQCLSQEPDYNRYQHQNAVNPPTTPS